MTLRVAWLTTGRGPGSFGALDYTFAAIQRGLPVEVTVVFVNRDRGEAEPTDMLIKMAETHGAPVETLSSVKFRKARGGKISKPGEPLQPWRLEYDAAVAETLCRHEFEMGVMFGYMLIATEPLYARFPFINDHPALPDGPIGTYQEVIAELIRTKAKHSGCLMHSVTGDVDRGPAVSFCKYPIHDPANEELWREAGVPASDLDELQQSPLYADIRARGVQRERPFLAETLEALAGGRLALGGPHGPLDLTKDVEQRIARERQGRR